MEKKKLNEKVGEEIKRLEKMKLARDRDKVVFLEKIIKFLELYSKHEDLLSRKNNDKIDALLARYVRINNELFNKYEKKAYIKFQKLERKKRKKGQNGNGKFKCYCL